MNRAKMSSAGTHHRGASALGLRLPGGFGRQRGKLPVAGVRRTASASSVCASRTRRSLSSDRPSPVWTRAGAAPERRAASVQTWSARPSPSAPRASDPARRGTSRGAARRSRRARGTPLPSGRRRQQRSRRRRGRTAWALRDRWRRTAVQQIGQTSPGLRAHERRAEAVQVLVSHVQDRQRALDELARWRLGVDAEAFTRKATSAASKDWGRCVVSSPTSARASGRAPRRASPSARSVRAQ